METRILWSFPSCSDVPWGIFSFHIQVMLSHNLKPLLPQVLSRHGSLALIAKNNIISSIWIPYRLPIALQIIFHLLKVQYLVVEPSAELVSMGKVFL